MEIQTADSGRVQMVSTADAAVLCPAAVAAHAGGVPEIPGRVEDAVRDARGHRAGGAAPTL